MIWLACSSPDIEADLPVFVPIMTFRDEPNAARGHGWPERLWTDIENGSSILLVVVRAWHRSHAFFLPPILVFPARDARLIT